MGDKCPGFAAPSLADKCTKLSMRKGDRQYKGQSEGVKTFFCSSLEFGRKTDVMTFEELTCPSFAQCKYIQPAGMGLNCPSPYQFLGKPLL